MSEIDVSKCEFYSDGYCDCYYEVGYESDIDTWDNCKEHQDCYFKQLQQLKQENEKLKKQYNCYICGNCKGKEDYSNLERHYGNVLKSLHKQYKKLEKIKELIINNDNYFTDDILQIIESEE